MQRGSTSPFTFALPYDTAALTKVRVIYTQGDKIVLKKEKEACGCNGNVLTVTLTQEETFLFDCEKPAEVQVRIMTTDGKVRGSIPKIFSVEKCLDDEVL
jgi:hypothetical protein